MLTDIRRAFGWRPSDGTVFLWIKKVVTFTTFLVAAAGLFSGKLGLADAVLGFLLMQCLILFTLVSIPKLLLGNQLELHIFPFRLEFDWPKRGSHG